MMKWMLWLKRGGMREANGNHLHTSWLLAVLELQLLQR
jgi:hypothetical protein